MKDTPIFVEPTPQEKFKAQFKKWVPTILTVVAALVNQYLMPFLLDTTAVWSWPLFAVVGLVALLNAFKSDDNPIRFLDTTIFGIILAVIEWVIIALGKHPIVFDWRTLLVVIIPLVLGAISRGLKEGFYFNPKTLQ